MTGTVGVRTRQIIIAIGIIVLHLLVGMTSGFSAILIPQLNATINQISDNNSFDYYGLKNLRITTVEEESWIGASGALLMAPGCWLAGLTMEKLGRRLSMMLLSPIFLLGWQTIVLSQNMKQLIIGRLICGLCSGYNAPLTSVYIGEIFSTKKRGLLITINGAALSMGILISHALGTWLDWRTSGFFCGTFSILSGICSLFYEESPNWLLIEKNEEEKARRSWISCRGMKNLEEFETLNRNREKEDKGYLKKRFLKPLWILSFLFMATQFTGINAMIFYSVGILKNVTKPENAYIGSLLLDSVRVISCLINCYFINNYPRKIIGICSCSMTGIILFLLGGFLYLDFRESYLTLILIFIYVIVTYSGLTVLPWIMCAELFPRRSKGLGSGFTCSVGLVSLFLVVKTAPFFMNILLPYGTFFVYGSVAFFTAIFIHFFLPETKGQTLQEIEMKIDSI